MNEFNIMYLSKESVGILHSLKEENNDNFSKFKDQQRYRLWRKSNFSSINKRGVNIENISQLRSSSRTELEDY